MTNFARTISSDFFAGACRRSRRAYAQDRAATAERQRRYVMGHLGEWLAAVFLMAKGYRILARRYRRKCGEIDLVAVRAGVVAFVEVKLRASLEEAEAALRPDEARRTQAAADRWIAARRRYQRHEQRFDAILLVPGLWPRHIEDAF